jgi:hypothetical protein
MAGHLTSLQRFSKAQPYQYYRRRNNTHDDRITISGSIPISFHRSRTPSPHYHHHHHHRCFNSTIITHNTTPRSSHRIRSIGLQSSILYYLARQPNQPATYHILPKGTRRVGPTPTEIPHRRTWVHDVPPSTTTNATRWGAYSSYIHYSYDYYNCYLWSTVEAKIEGEHFWS